jgi:hypothetical protein
MVNPTKLVCILLMFCCVAHSRATTNREIWSQTFPQQSVVSLFPDRLGHAAAVLAASGSNLIVLLNSNGTIAAATALNASANLPSPVQAAAADYAGNIFIAGQANPPTSYVSVVKFAPNLVAPAWTNTVLLTNPIAPGKFSVVRDVMTDDAGNAYCLGRFNQFTGDIDQFILSVGPAGARWMDDFNPSQDNDFDKGVTLLRAGDGTFFSVGFSDHYSPSGSSVLVRRFTPNGQVLWASNYLAPVDGNSYAFSETAAAAVIDSQWRVIVAGGRIQGFDRGYVVMQIDSSGHLLWRTIFDHTENNFSATGVDVDLDDNVFVTGPAGTLKLSPQGELIWFSEESASMVRVRENQSIVLSGAARDGSPRTIETKELSNSGELLWRARFNGGVGDLSFQTMFLDGTGTICVGANSSDGTTGLVYKYQEPPRLNVIRTSSTMTLSWSAVDTNVVLTAATDVNAATWEVVTNQPARTGNECRLVLPPANAMKFYRLELH